MTAYQPTQEEFVRTRRPSDDLKVSGDGVFATLQGEGASAGRPSVFLRLQNCNLHCGQDDLGWKCDAWYTWDSETPEYWQETRLASTDEIAEEVVDAWTGNFNDVLLRPNLVVTGGEPLLQQRKLVPLAQKMVGWHFEVETNGTIAPADELSDWQINCSPKLATSGNQLRARRRMKALQTIASFPDHWFKFVITNPEQDIPEVQGLMHDINGSDYTRVLLMSEGVAGRELTSKRDELLRIAAQLGCGITDRNHIFWFGDKRAT